MKGSDVFFVVRLKNWQSSRVASDFNSFDAQLVDIIVMFHACWWCGWVPLYQFIQNTHDTFPTVFALLRNLGASGNQNIITVLQLPLLLNCLFWRRSEKHQNSASLAFVRGIHRGPVNSRHKWPVKRMMFPFDDVIMIRYIILNILPVSSYTSREVVFCVHYYCTIYDVCK